MNVLDCETSHSFFTPHPSFLSAGVVSIAYTHTLLAFYTDADADALSFVIFFGGFFGCVLFSVRYIPKSSSSDRF